MTLAATNALRAREHGRGPGRRGAAALAGTPASFSHLRARCPLTSAVTSAGGVAQDRTRTGPGAWGTLPYPLPFRGRLPVNRAPPPGLTASPSAQCSLAGRSSPFGCPGVAGAFETSPRPSASWFSWLVPTPHPDFPGSRSVAAPAPPRCTGCPPDSTSAQRSPRRSDARAEAASRFVGLSPRRRQDPSARHPAGPSVLLSLAAVWVLLSSPSGENLL